MSSLRTMMQAVLILGWSLAVTQTLAAQGDRLDVTLETDEADAVLTILETRAAGDTVGPGAWHRLFSSEGYRRLQEREAAMRVPFTDDEFRSFVLNPDLARRTPVLRRTVESWKAADLHAAAARAFAYLPEGAAIRATVYPVIKPKANSFVWELDRDPAIFLYVDPDLSARKFENTVAHELHHVGYAGACPAPEPSTPDGVRTAREWVTGLGEGVAMLAAAGGPDIHPHTASDPEERAVWDRDVARRGRDLARIDRFLLELAEGRLSDPEAIRERGFALVVSDGVPQGPFYTVGWVVAATVERELGRDRLVAALCHPGALLAAYNQAAARVNRRGEGPLPLWSERLVRTLTR